MKCAKCGKKIGTFENTEKNKEGEEVCTNCKKKLEEKELQQQNMQQKRLKDLEEQEKKEFEKKLIKEYGGKFQAYSIKELIEISSHLKRIRSYMGWILAIIVIGIIITLFSSVKVLT